MHLQLTTTRLHESLLGTQLNIITSGVPKSSNIALLMYCADLEVNIITITVISIVTPTEKLVAEEWHARGLV